VLSFISSGSFCASIQASTSWRSTTVAFPTQKNRNHHYEAFPPRASWWRCVLGDVFDSKAEHSALRLSGDEVDEIDFAGKEMAITFHSSAEQGAATNAQRRNEDGE